MINALPSFAITIEDKPKTTSVNIPDLFFPALVLLGLVLGFVGSWISARKYFTYKLIS